MVSPDADGLPRTWNAKNDPGAPADLEYLQTVLDEVQSVLNVDAARAYSVGFSAGGSMSHALACTMADTFAAVVSVGGVRELAPPVSRRAPSA